MSWAAFDEEEEGAESRHGTRAKLLALQPHLHGDGMLRKMGAVKLCALHPRDRQPVGRGRRVKDRPGGATCCTVDGDNRSRRVSLEPEQRAVLHENDPPISWHNRVGRHADRRLAAPFAPELFFKR